MAPAPELLARFAADLDALVEPGSHVGVAVSGGPDSLALLLLAREARPGRVLAATVDHGLRAGSAAEAETVADSCRTMGVPHSTLRLHWPTLPTGNIQAEAREQRYAALGGWADEQGLTAVATAHHLDDQAETVLLRVARGAGIGGLAGVQPSRPIGSDRPRVRLVRPLLSWTRDELGALVARSGVEAAIDPSNNDSRYDRTAARRLLRTTAWLDPTRLASVADHARDADEALDFAASVLLAERVVRRGRAVHLDARELPRELQRRLLLRSIAELAQLTPSGPKLSQALERLRQGRTTTLCGLKLQGGETWTIEPAPPRRTSGQG